MCLPKITVIVPIYKVEDYLVKCVDSLLHQTYQNLEIILVDDGSPDRCGAICDEYAAMYSQVRVIHKRNAGPGFARNAGMEIAQGEYILFVDADDYLANDAVQVLYERIVADGSDIAVGRHTDIYENGNTNDVFCRWMKDDVMSASDVLAAMGNDHRIAVVAWAKLYRREILAGIQYPALKYSEDLWVFPQIIERCKRISIVDHLVYYYLQRSTSVLHNPTDERIRDDVHAGLAFVRYLWDHGYPKSAVWWLTVKLDKALMLRDKRVADVLFDQYFSRQEIRKLLKAAGVKTSVKWMALHHPAMNVCLQTAKRLMKRG